MARRLRYGLEGMEGGRASEGGRVERARGSAGESSERVGCRGCGQVSVGFLVRAGGRIESEPT